MVWLSHLTQQLAALPAECDASFFGIPPWYKYLPMEVNNGVCSVSDNFKLLGAGTDSGLLLIGLAIVDMLLRIAGMVAVGFVIWGGIQYQVSQGEASKVAAAKHTVINALVGLGIAMVATSIVVFVGNNLAG